MNRPESCDTAGHVPHPHTAAAERHEGHPHERELFRAVADELTEKFGGLTAHTRAPAEGLWKEDSSATSKDEIVIHEVMAEDLDEKWWREYRRGLEKRFRQEQVIVRAQEVRLL